jgi:GNAT acetyltransferase-like protein
VLTPVPRDIWASVLQASAEATIYQTPEWLDACCAGGEFQDASRLYETGDGRQIIVPMVRPGGRVLLRVARSMPNGWGFGGAIAPGRVRPEDVSMVLDDLLESTRSLVLKPGPVSANAWNGVQAQQRFPHCIHIVDIRAGFEALWSSEFSSDTRNKVRKAEKRGVEVRWGRGTELAKVHWEIYLRWAAHRARVRGIPVPLGLARAKRDQPSELFANVAEHLAHRCQVVVATIDGEAVASAVVLFDGAYAHYWRAASDRDADTSRYANHLIVARVLEKAAERGHQFLEMGESGGVRSLMDFKEHFGAKPRPYDVLLFGPRAMTAAMLARDRIVSTGSDLALGALARLRGWRERAR